MKSRFTGESRRPRVTCVTAEGFKGSERKLVVTLFRLCKSRGQWVTRVDEQLLPGLDTSTGFVTVRTPGTPGEKRPEIAKEVSKDGRRKSTSKWVKRSKGAVRASIKSTVESEKMSV